jgi:hypothetical protein
MRFDRKIIDVRAQVRVQEGIEDSVVPEVSDRNGRRQKADNGQRKRGSEDLWK